MSPIEEADRVNDAMTTSVLELADRMAKLAPVLESRINAAQATGQQEGGERNGTG